MSEWLARGGIVLFLGTLLACCGAALVQVLQACFAQESSEERQLARVELRRGVIAGAVLVFVQIVFIIVCHSIAWLRPAAGLGYFYLGCAVAVPFLWAGGQLEQARLGWPVRSASWRQVAVVAGVGVFVSVLSMGVFALAAAEPGESVQELGRRAENVTTLAVIAIWLIINAPWVEELVFRHYLLARVTTGPATLFFALVISTLIFAVGHGGHMDPAWPKMVQMTMWGFVLGGLRIWLGSMWAIGFHLALNLMAPVVAIFL